MLQAMAGKEIMLKSNERIEDLQLDDLKIIQASDGYCFTSDAVILANFIDAKPNHKLLEIGSGSGIISILVAYKTKCEDISAVEIQSTLAEMSQRSVELNNLQNVIKIYNSDIKDFAKTQKSYYDIVYSNPPYSKLESVIPMENEQQQICRYEKSLNLEELISCASKLLKDKGHFYAVYDAERVVDLIACLRNNRLEPKRLFFTQASSEKNAKLIVIDAVKNGKPSAKVLPTLITNDTDGSYIYTIQKLYKRDK